MTFDIPGVQGWWVFLHSRSSEFSRKTGTEQRTKLSFSLHSCDFVLYVLRDKACETIYLCLYQCNFTKERYKPTSFMVLFYDFVPVLK